MNLRSQIASPLGVRLLASCLFLGLFLASPCIGQEPQLSWHSHSLTLPWIPDVLLPIDLTKDGRAELLAARGAEFQLYTYNDSGYSNEHSQTVAIPSEVFAWTVVDVDGDSYPELLAIDDGGKVQSWHFGGTALEPEKILAQCKSVRLPSGHYTLDFLRDVDLDSDLDLLIPSREGFQIFLQQDDNSFKLGPLVQSRFNLRQNLNTKSDTLEGMSLDATVGQSIVIPELQLLDLNGDQRIDIRSHTDDFLLAYLAREDGTYGTQPDYEFDLASAR